MTVYRRQSSSELVSPFAALAARLRTAASIFETVSTLSPSRTPDLDAALFSLKQRGTADAT